MQRKKELRYKSDQEKFETNKFTEFKIAGLAKTKDEAVKLYQEVIIVHFYDFYLRFEKWMSDLIKLHNDIMSVQKKLIDCEKEMNAPFDRNDKFLDTKLNTLIECILNVNKSAMPINNLNSKPPIIANYMPPTPSNTLSSSFNGSGNGNLSNSKENSELPLNSSAIAALSSSGSGDFRNGSMENGSLNGNSRNSRLNMDSLVARLIIF